MKHCIVQVRGSVRFLLPLPSVVQYVLTNLLQFNSACTRSSKASSSQWTAFQRNIFITVLQEVCYRHCALQPAKILSLVANVLFSLHFCYSYFLIPSSIALGISQPFKAQWLLYVQSGLTFNYTVFCPHNVFICFTWISEQTAIISLYSINCLVFITETECVYCVV